MGILNDNILSRIHHVYRAGLSFLVLTLIIVSAVLLNQNVFADTISNRSGNHVITIYDNGAEKTIISPANTVSEALRDADITLSQYDLVDPGRSSEIVNGSNVITIRRARTIVVHDGSREVRVITAAQTSAEIASVANIKIYAEDQTKIAPVDDVLASGGAGLALNITRAKVINLRLYGQDMQVRTQSKTVSEFLKEKNIKLGQDDGMNLDANSPVTNQMELQIWRNGIQTITATETVPYDTKIVRDSAFKIGYRQVQTQGQDGQKTVIYQIEMRDNKEVGRTKISEVVNIGVVQQVEVIGTKVDLPSGSHTDWMNAAGIPAKDQGYVNYIFSQESSWRPNAKNPSGKYVGLGQTNPNVLSAACQSWESDPVCQIIFFDGYAKRRYGSWEKAWDFWTKNHWW